MKRELVPFNDMWHVTGSVDVFRLKSYTSSDLILCGINSVDKSVRVPFKAAHPLKNVTIDGINVGDAFDRLYDKEMSGEDIPTPEELDVMNELGTELGFINFTPLSMSKVLSMYYEVMKLVDDFDDIEDPYDLLNN